MLRCPANRSRAVEKAMLVPSGDQAGAPSNSLSWSRKRTSPPLLLASAIPDRFWAELPPAANATCFPVRRESRRRGLQRRVVRQVLGIAARAEQPDVPVHGEGDALRVGRPGQPGDRSSCLVDPFRVLAGRVHTVDAVVARERDVAGLAEGASVRQHDEEEQHDDEGRRRDGDTGCDERKRRPAALPLRRRPALLDRRSKPADVVAPLVGAVPERHRLPVREGLQRLGKLRSLRALCPVDEHRDDAHALREGGLDLDSHPVVGLLQAALPALVDGGQPVGPDHRQEHVAASDGRSQHLSIVLSRADRVGVHEHAVVAVPSGQRVVEPPCLAGGIVLAVVDEDADVFRLRGNGMSTGVSRREASAFKFP